MKTRLVLLPSNIEPIHYHNDDTLVLRVKPAQANQQLFSRAPEVEYYGKNGFRWTSGVKVNDLPFPENNKPSLIINDSILTSRIANRIDEFKVWQRKTICENNHHQETFQKHYMDGVMQTFSGEKFKHYNVQSGADFAQVDVLFYGFNRYGLKIDLDTIVYIAASDAIMNKFAELLKDKKHIYYEKDNNFVQSENPNLYTKVQSFQFFVPNGCKLMPEILRTFEKAANIALDDDIYAQAARSKDIPEIKYEPQTIAANFGAKCS